MNMIFHLPTNHLELFSAALKIGTRVGAGAGLYRDCFRAREFQTSRPRLFHSHLRRHPCHSIITERVSASYYRNLSIPHHLPCHNSVRSLLHTPSQSAFLGVGKIFCFPFFSESYSFILYSGGVHRGREPSSVQLSSIFTIIFAFPLEGREPRWISAHSTAWYVSPRWCVCAGAIPFFAGVYITCTYS